MNSSICIQNLTKISFFLCITCSVDLDRSLYRHWGNFKLTLAVMVCSHVTHWILLHGIQLNMTWVLRKVFVTWNLGDGGVGCQKVT